MSNNLEKNVHILPLGHEIERAVAPFANRHVDKVYLVVDEGKDEMADESEMRPRGGRHAQLDSATASSRCRASPYGNICKNCAP